MNPVSRGPQRLILLAVLPLAGCWGDSEPPPPNVRPSFLGTIKTTTYDGVSDDLLTAGLGKSGLASAAAPTYANTASPTAAELRRAAIYTNYRAIVDTTASGGYGTLYGPNVTASNTVTSSEGKVAGTEYIAFADDGSGAQNVTLMVQLPASFDRANPCVITATSSGSRGVYGAIGVGEWGLRRGCAVAYTDKGTGAAPHDLANDTVPLIDGTRSSSSAAGTGAAFRAALSASELAAFNTATPNRFAFKHAHSQQNPEKDWGKNTLQAVEFAYYMINERFGDLDALGARIRSFTPANTIVIASSLSNGGGAAIAAAEQDTQGLISGVAVSEPEVQLPAAPGVSVKRGAITVAVIGKPLLDYMSAANLYQGCAAIAASAAGSPGVAFVAAATAANRCTALKTKGLLSATTTAAQAEEAQQKLVDYGYESESKVLHASLYAFATPAVSVTYATTYSRASVKDNTCGFSFAATGATGAPGTLANATLAQLFALGNGVPPNSGINIINNLNPAGPLLDAASLSPSSSLPDFNADGALCIRNLAVGSDAAALKAKAAVDEVRRNGNLRGKPAIIVHGRSDALLPANHTSRPYYALNKIAEGASSKLSYIEVTNAQHFDAFIGNAALPGYDTRYIPLHAYLFRALDAVYANLKTGAALPPSQVVRTVPRGGVAGAAPAITSTNVPPIQAAPTAADAITFSGTTVTIPD